MYFLKVDKVCDTEDVEQQSITFEKECKEVTSKVCGPAAAVHPYGIIKREAEAEAEVRTPSRIVQNPTFYQPIPQRFRIYLCEIHAPPRNLCSFDGYHWTKYYATFKFRLGHNAIFLVTIIQTFHPLLDPSKWFPWPNFRLTLWATFTELLIWHIPQISPK